MKILYAAAFGRYPDEGTTYNIRVVEDEGGNRAIETRVKHEGVWEEWREPGAEPPIKDFIVSLVDSLLAAKGVCDG